MTRTAEYERGQALGMATVHVNCYTCGVDFAFPQAFYDMRLIDHQTFYCPFGHKAHYPEGKSRLEEEREALAAAERRAATAQRRADEQAARADVATDQLRRTSQRATAGVCTCCNRSFPNVAAHMVTEHPEVVLDLSEHYQFIVDRMADFGAPIKAAEFVTLVEWVGDGRLVGTEFAWLRNRGLVERDSSARWSLTHIGQAAANIETAAA